MAEMRKRTSMSVLEMGRMLGLGKTESYWLIKKNYFKTILVGNTMRVMIDSFEEWYANQFKYQKVDGTPPGEELKKTTYSMEELGQRLGLKEATAYELVAKGHFDVVDVLGKRRVTKLPVYLMVNGAGVLIVGQLILCQHVGQSLTLCSIKVKKRIVDVQQDTSVNCHILTSVGVSR